MANGQNSFSDYSDSCSLSLPEMDFAGLLIEHWPNGQLKYRGEFKKNQMRVGQHQLFWSNGVLRELSHWDEGWVCGVLLRFEEDGRKDLEVYYGEDGGRKRSWVECHFGEIYDCRPFWVAMRENDEIVREWRDPELERIMPTEKMMEIVEGVVRRYFPERFPKTGD